MSYNRLRGTVDLYSDAAIQFSGFEQILRYIAQQYDFNEIRTPIFEVRELFLKAVGESSDIVNKEFYDFQDKGERWVVLRPEGTAGTIRAIVENKLLNNLAAPLKVFYLGPMFRYERPQSGRQRQFHQFGVEVVGNLNVHDEIDCLNMAISILSACQITNYKLEINNIGDIQTRSKWINALKVYFEPFKDQLSEDSIRRLQTNPLRILDDKIDGVKPFVKNAPQLDKFLSDEQKQYFTEVCKLLKILDISYTVNNNLVRGLDYYNGLVFEFVSTSEKLKGQSTILGGGRYNELVEQTGGPNVPGFGFALGMERMLIALLDEHPDFFVSTKLDVLLAPLAESVLDTTLVLNMVLRNAGFSVGVNYHSFKIDKHFKYADQHKCRFIVILGEQELAKKVVKIKDQQTKLEEEVDILNIHEYLQGKLNA